MLAHENGISFMLTNVNRKGMDGILQTLIRIAFTEYRITQTANLVPFIISSYHADSQAGLA